MTSAIGGVPDCDRAIDDYRKVLALDADDTARRIAQGGLDKFTAAWVPH